MIQFHCPGCDRTYKVPADAGGRRAKCAGCGIEFNVPFSRPGFSEPSTPLADETSVSDTSTKAFLLTPKQRKIIWAGITCIPLIVVCALLLWALKPGNPYGYYVLLRWACCGVFAYVTLRALAQEKPGWGWVLGITATIYNPIIPLHLTREIWLAINFVTIGIAVASAFALNLDTFRTRPSMPREVTERTPSNTNSTEIFGLVAVLVYLAALGLANILGAFAGQRQQPPGRRARPRIPRRR